MIQPRYKRVLLKLSGEAFKGPTAYGIDAPTVSFVASRIKQARELGVEIAIVVGGGNIWRGAQAEKDGFDRVTADYAGMLATAINTLALQDTLELVLVLDLHGEVAGEGPSVVLAELAGYQMAVVLADGPLDLGEDLRLLTSSDSKTTGGKG